MPTASTDVVDVTDAALARMRGEEVFPFSTPVYRPRSGHRALWLAMAVVVACAAVVSWFYLARSGEPLTNLSSQVVNSGEIPLNFSQAGVLSAIKVTPGEKVAAGQVLAVESVPGLAGAVSAALQAVAGDRQEIQALNALLGSVQSSSGTSATEIQASNSEQLAAAKGQLATAESSFAAAKSAGAAAVNQLNALIASDQAQVASACGGGFGWLRHLPFGPARSSCRPGEFGARAGYGCQRGGAGILDDRYRSAHDYRSPGEPGRWRRLRECSKHRGRYRGSAESADPGRVGSCRGPSQG